MGDKPEKKNTFDPMEAVDGATLMSYLDAVPEQLVGTKIGRYEILKLLGKGGMSWIFQVKDPYLTEPQVLKIIKGERSLDPLSASLIKKEAERTLALNHPGVIRTFGLEEWNGHLVLRMEYLEGQSLNERLVEQCPLPEKELTGILHQLLTTLDYVHTKADMIHRDIKPKNIFLCADGIVKLLDFGISFRINQSSLTQVSSQLSSAGTPHFMSPEQAKGIKTQGPEVDIWALGVTLYQCATGEYPFNGNSDTIIVEQILRVKPQQPRELNPDISPVLNHIIMTCLQKNPADRYPSAAAILSDLESGITGETGDIAVTTSIDCTVYLDGKEQGETVNRFLSIDDVAYGEHTIKGETAAHRGETGVIVEGPLTRMEVELTHKTGTLYAKSRIGLYQITIGNETQDCPVILEDLPVGELDSTLTINGEDYPVTIAITGDETCVYELNEAKLKELKAEKARRTAEATARAEKERAEKAAREQVEREQTATAAITGDNATILELDQSTLDDLKAEKEEQAATAAKRAEAERLEQEKREAAEQAERERRAQQQEEETSKGRETAVRLPGNVSLSLVHIPSGSFMMGSPSTESHRSDDEGPRHRVTISRGFYMGRYEITQKQWQSIMGNNPSDFKGDNLPVEQVSWNDVQDFIKKLNAQTGQRFRLPTEAEWEYACRAGTGTAFHYGNSLSSDMANFNGNYPYNASKGRYKEKTTPVGSFQPNAFGLYDMHGNVWEWCSDWYGKDYYKNSPSTDPTGPASGVNRVLRGGSWANYAQYCRSALRRGYIPSVRDFLLGFRLICDE